MGWEGIAKVMPSYFFITIIIVILIIGREGSFIVDMFDNYPDVVDVNQLNEMFGGNFSKKLLYRLLRDQEIKNRKIGREYRISKRNVIEYLSK